jgi:hypothetical protein
MATKSTAAARTSTAAEPAVLTLVLLASWLVPGAGHLWFGRRQKGLIFLVALPLMFITGIWLQGRMFPFELSDPLVGLAAVANLGIGATWFIARALDLGAGVVTAATYEYGNTFMIVAGLLNFMVMLDAFDIGMGRK